MSKKHPLKGAKGNHSQGNACAVQESGYMKLSKTQLKHVLQIFIDPNTWPTHGLSGYNFLDAMLPNCLSTKPHWTFMLFNIARLRPGDGANRINQHKGAHDSDTNVRVGLCNSRHQEELRAGGRGQGLHLLNLA